MSKSRNLAKFTSDNEPLADGVLDKSDISLGNVDNTSDLDKPVSTATQSAIDDVSQVFTATVTGSNGTSDWANSDPYIATITVSGILSTDTPVVDLDMSNVAFADVPVVVGEFGLVYRVDASADDEIKLYATAEPTQDFDLIIQVIR